ncbi:uncharacterized protein LOC126831890 [Patella vulgata]|uniref:uncharacterized protein LOC126831890 n=1 Tax=Patella vulgata TaxID=6465 RepID=UPI0024A8B22E|nr:uncharacterized protein LOC126831890 [Patella vulgata]
MWQVGFVLFNILSARIYAASLGSYNVDSNQVSVSGISSGAAMATQVHVALSSRIMGVGLVAGLPYMCAEGLAVTALTCMNTPGLVSVSVLEGITASADLVGNIDSTSNIATSKVYIFAGTKDTVVKPGNGPKIEQYYKHYISDNSNIKTVYNVPAEHCMPTSNYGGNCGTLNKDNYINNCGYSAAFDLLNHIYGGHLVKPTDHTTANGQLLTFSQSAFFYWSLPSVSGMDTTGYVYIPTKCATKQTKCKLHIAFHGCLQGRKAIGDVYVKHAGYNEVGELNDIIILYPQAISTPLNQQGCWDWFGYTGPLYATKNGFQITAVRRMIDRVL